MTARAVETSTVSAFALLLTLVLAAPVLRAPSERLFGMEIAGRHHDPFTVMEQFSRPITLGVYSQPLTDVPGSMIARAAGPVAAYNWLVLLTFPLSAAAAYLLARYLALSPAGAAIAALAFAFSPFHLSHAAYHPHIAQVQWIPLYFLALWRCLDEATPAAVAWLALAVAGVALSNFYGGLIAAVVTPAAAGAYWWTKRHRGPRPGRRLAITTGSLMAIAAAGFGYIWYAARALVIDPAALAFPREDLFRFSAKWWSYLIPPIEHPWLGGFAEHVWRAAGVDVGRLEQQVSLGWGLVALSLVAIGAWLFRGRQPASLAVVPVLVTVAAVALVCSLSPEREIGSFTVVRPSALLYRMAPMFRAYARFGVVVQLMTALLAAIGAERLWLGVASRAGRVSDVVSRTAPRTACVVLLTLATFEYTVRPSAMSRDVLPTPAHRWVARQPVRASTLDCAPLTAESESIQWLSQDRIAPARGTFDDCAEPNVADKLAAAGYAQLIVRRDTQEGWWFARQRALPGLQMAAHFADADVYGVKASPPLVYTAQMLDFYGREYDGAASWRWMGPDASWTITNAARRPLVADVDIDLSAFHGARQLQIVLDGRTVQTLTVDEGNRVHRIGPLALVPGDHALVFHPADPPAIADDVVRNGDRRPLSFEFGAWRWMVEAEHR